MVFILILFLSYTVFSLDFFPIENLKEGMVGEVKTCLKGTELKTYPVEIKGIIRGNTEKDLVILGKILAPEFEKTGIVAGMSGSPVLIEGKILGALAYAWLFSKEPLCGITYWKNMLELKAEGIKKVNYLSIEDLNLNFEDLSLKLKKEFEKLIENLNGIKLQSYPFMENNFSVLEGGIVKKDINYPLESGYPVSGMLAWGDFNLFASGTITFKDGDTIYAFGHPFLDLGKVEMPFARAYPELVVPTLYNSFRLSNGGEIIGTLEIDGKDGVLGKVNKFPEGVKVKISLNNKIKNFQVMNHPLLSPILTALGASFLFYDEKKDSGSGTILMEVKMSGKDEIKKDFFLQSNDLFSSIFSSISPFLGIFYLNPFKEFKTKEIEINFKEIKEKNKFQILKVISEKTKLFKEKEVNLKIFLEDYFGNKEILNEKLFFKGKENIEIYVSGGKEIEKLFKKEQIFLKDFYELKKTVEEKPQDGFLYIYIKTQENSLLLNPYTFEKLSPSFLMKFPENQIKNYRIYKFKELELPYPVEGFYEIKIEGEK